MPPRGWYDATVGVVRPFGSQFESSVPPEMLVLMEERIVKSAARHDYGMRLSPSRLTSTPRQVLIEKFVDYALDPEEEVGKFIGTVVHEALEVGLRRIGYETEQRLAGEITLGGRKYEIVGVPDACWVHKEEPPDHLPHIVELKTTSSGSIRFMLEDGEPKKDHVAAVSIYGHLYAQTRGIPVENVRATIRYFCIPQKERLQGAYTRMPSSLPFPIPRLMSMAEIAAVIPGYTPPTKPNHYQGPPPGTVAMNADELVAAFERIAKGESPKSVIESFGCECDRRFNGGGRDYCSVMRDCAMMHHGTPMW